MNSYVNQRLSQRKASFSHLQKSKTSRISIQNETSRQTLKNITNLVQDSNQILNKLKTTQAFQMIKNKQQQPKYKQQQRDKQLYSQSKRSSSKSRLRNQQSSDYIRNLYKKYLGKQNKENKENKQNKQYQQNKLNKQYDQNKSNLDILTQRKLRTVQIKQFYQITDSKQVSKNQNFKDYTKKALFKNDDQCQSINSIAKYTNNTNIKCQKTKISTILKNEKQIQHKTAFNANKQQTKVNKQQPSKQFQSKKSKQYNSKPTKQSQNIKTKHNKSKTQQKNRCFLKQNFKQPIQQYKKTNKNIQDSVNNYSFNIKYQKEINQKQKLQKGLTRSSSTQLKRQSIQNTQKYFCHDYQHKKKSKMCTQVGQEFQRQRKQSGTSLTSFRNLQSSLKKKILTSNQKDQIHPHRDSYCQFDTQQEIINKNQHNKTKIQSQPYLQQKISKYKPNTISFSKKQINNQINNKQNLQNGQNQQNNQRSLKRDKNGMIFDKFINDIDTLKILVGQQSSIYKLLSRINKVKNNTKNKQNQFKQQKQKVVIENVFYE